LILNEYFDTIGNIRWVYIIYSLPRLAGSGPNFRRARSLINRRRPGKGSSGFPRFVKQMPLQAGGQVDMVNMFAVKIKMRQGCISSQELLEIDSIYLDGCEDPGFYKKEAIHDYLTMCPNTIHAGIPPYPA